MKEYRKLGLIRRGWRERSAAREALFLTFAPLPDPAGAEGGGRGPAGPAEGAVGAAAAAGAGEATAGQLVQWYCRLPVSALVRVARREMAVQRKRQLVSEGAAEAGFARQCWLGANGTGGKSSGVGAGQKCSVSRAQCA